MNEVIWFMIGVAMGAGAVLFLSWFSDVIQDIFRRW